MIDQLRFIAMVLVPLMALLMSFLAIMALPFWAGILVALGALAVSVGSIGIGAGNT